MARGPRRPPPARSSKTAPSPTPKAYDHVSSHLPPPPAPKAPSGPSRAWRVRGPALVGGGITALGAGLYIFFTIAAYRCDHDHYANIGVPDDVSDRYNNVRFAEDFDDSVNSMERLMGITKLRRQLLAKAKGHVLEASVGTGRNAPHYPLTKAVASVTMVDSSEDMLRVARRKWAETNSWFIHALFRVQSAADPVPLPKAALPAGSDGFDTVVQTMGLCSTPEPERLLRNLADMCRRDGNAQILLLEHGRGRYGILNSMLDYVAPARAARHGCWANKDIAQIVRDSGLEIVEQRRYHAGTTYWFVLRPSANKAERKVDAKTNGETAAQRPWWASWWK